MEGRDWKSIDITDQETGEIRNVLSGFVMTFKGKYECLIEEAPELDFAEAGDTSPTHRIKIRSSYGEFLDAGGAWQRTSPKGLTYFSVGIRHPEKIAFALFPNDKAPGTFRASFN